VAVTSISLVLCVALGVLGPTRKREKSCAWIVISGSGGESLVDDLYASGALNLRDVIDGSRCHAGVVGSVLIRLPAGREVTKSFVSRSEWKFTPQRVTAP
jgi:hypothetical protein